MLNLGREKFKSWLETASFADNIAGYPEDPCNCPIANFLKDGEDYLWLEVGDEEVDICYDGDRNAISHPLPDWAKKFIEKIDIYPSEFPIRSGLAIAILASIDEGRN